MYMCRHRIKLTAQNRTKIEREAIYLDVAENTFANSGLLCSEATLARGHAGKSPKSRNHTFLQGSEPFRLR